MLENEIGVEVVVDGVVGTYEFIPKPTGSANRISLKIKNILTNTALTVEGKIKAITELVNKYN